VTTSSAQDTRLSVGWTACDGRGLCAELLPELITRDDWGYPLLQTGGVPADLEPHARRAIRDCPTLALRLRRTDQRT
jgi:ferredoxin